MTPASPVRFSVGSVPCAVVGDGTARFGVRAFFANAADDALTGALSARGLPSDVLPTPLDCLLLRVAGAIVLVDTGYGDAQPGTGLLAENLRRAGVAPDEVDLVVLTHAHPDHIGGAVSGDGTPAFPNARYVLSRAEWDHWSGGGREPVAGTLERLADRADLVSGPAELRRGLGVFPVPGHTPGQIAVRLESDGEVLVHTADVVAHPLHLEHPDWHIVSDVDPSQAIATRIGLLDRLADEGALAFVPHFPFGRPCRVERAGATWRSVPAEGAR